MSAQTADPLRQPLLDAAELAGLIARGRRLARAADQGRAEAGRHGGGASRHPGSGLDFAEHRHYQPGDDPRRLDWRVTARIGQPHVRRYHEDLVPDCLILVDRRATMRFATRGRLKAAQAVRLAVLLAAFHSARQAPVSILELDTALHRHGPLGMAGLPALGRRLALPCPPVADPGPPLAEALAQLDRQVARDARLVLLSDFADAERIPPSLWHRLARRHRIQAIAIDDPAEQALPAGDGVSLCWNGPGGERSLALQPALAARIGRRHAERRAALAGDLDRVGIPLQQLSTLDEDPLAALRGVP